MRHDPWPPCALPDARVDDETGEETVDARDQSAREDFLERVMRVLETFSGGDPPLTLSEISTRSGLPMTTTHRMLQALWRVGALVRDDKRRYRLGRRLIDLAAQDDEAQTAAPGRTPPP